MITSDFLLRQIHQLGQVLAVVLFHKKAGRVEEAQQTLAEALESETETSLADLHTLGREETLALCEHEGVFSSDKALPLADLLREDASAAGRERALWIYEAARDAGDLVPLDIEERMAALRDDLRRGEPG